MAFTQTELDAFKPEGIEDAVWKDVGAKIIAAHDSEIKGLVDNEKALKVEKTAAIERYNREKAEWEQKASEYEKRGLEYSASLEELTRKLDDKNGSADALRAAYEQKEKTLTDQIAAMTEEHRKIIGERERKIAELEVGVFQRDCDELFSKAIVGKNVNPDELATVKKLALGEDYSQFARRDIGDGKYIITRSDGKDIEAAVDEFLSSPTGKLFRLNGNSGGGADGGKNTSPQGKTMTREQWNALPIEEQAAAALEYKIT